MFPPEKKEEKKGGKINNFLWELLEENIKKNGENN